jgi:hypothetical protein
MNTPTEVAGLGAMSLAAYHEVKPILKTLLGHAAEELAATLGDRIRVFRFEQQCKLLRRVQEKVNQEGIQMKSVNLKTLLPLLENAALEDDEEMSERWASLLTSASDPKSNGLEVSYTEILKQLPPKHAHVLDAFYDQIDQYKLDPKQWNEVGVAAEMFRELLGWELVEFNLAVDNLLRLRLINYPTVAYSVVNGNEVRLPVTSAQILCATQLGRSFVSACNRGYPPHRTHGYCVPSNSISNVFHTEGRPLTNPSLGHMLLSGIAR